MSCIVVKLTHKQVTTPVSVTHNSTKIEATATWTCKVINGVPLYVADGRLYAADGRLFTTKE